MDDLEELMSPFDGDVTLTRNATDLSRLSEALVRRFVDYRASSAVVHWRKTEYSMDDMYKGLRNVCKKNDYRGLVKVHRQEDKLILIRSENGRGIVL